MNISPFDTSESLAVARLVWQLIISDDDINHPESDFFDKMLQTMKLTFESFESSLSESIDHSYEVVKNMPAVKRRECGRLLRLAISSDNEVKLSELSRLNEILERSSLLRPDKKNVKKFEGGF